jgi:hypothetical protein
VTARGFAADVRDPAGLARTLEHVTESLGPIEVLQYSPLPQKDFMRPVLETAFAQLLHETLGQEGIHVGQLVIGGAIVAGDKEKDPSVLAEVIWDLHAKRDRFRVEVATG